MSFTKKNLSIVLLLVWVSYAMNAQKITLVTKHYVYENISTASSTSDWAHYFIVEGDREPRKAGYFGQHLKKEVQSDPDAVKYINAYAGRQAIKLTTTISTVVLFSVFAISNLSKESVAVENLDKPDKNRGFLVASIGTLAINLGLRIIHPKSIRKAVDSYNSKLGEKKIGLHSFFLDSQNIAGRKTFGAGVKINL